MLTRRPEAPGRDRMGRRVREFLAPSRSFAAAQGRGSSARRLARTCGDDGGPRSTRRCTRCAGPCRRWPWPGRRRRRRPGSRARCGSRPRPWSVWTGRSTASPACARSSRSTSGRCCGRRSSAGRRTPRAPAARSSCAAPPPPGSTAIAWRSRRRSTTWCSTRSSTADRESSSPPRPSEPACGSRSGTAAALCSRPLAPGASREGACASGCFGRDRHGHGLRVVRATASAHRGGFALHRSPGGAEAVLELPRVA